MDQTQHSINLLNGLIEINNDRITGYKKAEAVKLESLKELFQDMEADSKQFIKELSDVVTKLGGTPSTGNTVAGSIFHAYMVMQAGITGNDEQSILNSCEYGEDAAKKAYVHVLNDRNLLTELISLVQGQFLLMKDDHDKIKTLRDSWTVDTEN